jgi:2,3-bisphosphoglycerate-dependent phosphoglycerate mutase
VTSSFRKYFTPASPPDLDQLNRADFISKVYNKPAPTERDVVKMVFVRHGESTWNKSKKFTGWIDVPLSENGEQECRDAGKQLKELGYKFDTAYTSLLCRATKTLDLILEEMEQENDVEIVKHWKVNERHYGALQGRDKVQTAEEYGTE